MKVHYVKIDPAGIILCVCVLFVRKEPLCGSKCCSAHFYVAPEMKADFLLILSLVGGSTQR